MKIIKKYQTILLMTTILIMFYILFFVTVLKKPFLLDNDQWFQYNNFYEEWIRLIDDFINGKGLPFYSWNSYLGTDFYSSMGYYCTGNIFLPLMLLFKNNIYLYTVIETVICIYISVILMYIFLDSYKIKNINVKVFISLIYGFGGTSVIYFGDYMFHRFYSFIPLMLLGLTDYFNRKKTILFSISIAILFLQNYYLMWPLSILILIFCLLEEINTGNSIKYIFKDNIKLLLAYIVGFLISAIVSLPAIMYVLGNSRIGKANGNDLFWPLNVYFGILINFISVNSSGYMNTIASALTGDGHVYSYNLMIGAVPFVSALSYILKKENRHYLFFVLILMVCVLFKPLCSMLHGFSNPSFRWLVILNILLLIISAKSLDSQRNYNKEKRIYFVYLIINILLFVILVFFNIIDPIKYKLDIFMKIFSIIISSISIYFIDRSSKLSYIMNFILIMVSLCFILFLQTKDSHISEDRIDTNVFEYLNDVDEDIVFRYYVPYTSYDPGIFLQMNESLHYGFMSTSTYNSMVEPKISIFNTLNGFDSWQIEIDNRSTLNMLGVKYLLLSPNERKENLSNLEFVSNCNFYKMYRNLNYKGFAKTYSKIKYLNSIDSINEYDDTLFVDDKSISTDEYNNIVSESAVITEKGSNYLKGNIESSCNNILLIPVPNNGGWKVVLNGEKVNTFSVNGGFIGFEIAQGYNTFEMYFIPEYLKLGALLSFIGLGLLILSGFMQRKKFIKENQ